MCFSATASFAAAATLGVLGVITIRSARLPSHRWFAAIPLLFASQQLIEGLLWRSLTHTTHWRVFSPLVAFYMLFALWLWPAYVPFAVRRFEPRRALHPLLSALTAAGVVLGLYLYARSQSRGAYVCVNSSNLYYAASLWVPFWPLLHLTYLACTVGPLLVCSVRPARWFGVSLLVSYAATAALFKWQLVSVWCFLSAWLSVQVLFAVRSARVVAT